jgi:hypothetical protein
MEPTFDKCVLVATHCKEPANHQREQQGAPSNCAMGPRKSGDDARRNETRDDDARMIYRCRNDLRC